MSWTPPDPGHRIERLHFLAVALIIVSAAFTCTRTFAATATIPAAKDNTLFADPDGALSNGSGIHFFSGNNSGSNSRRGVIAFDIAAYVPAGSVIDSVLLVLNVSSAPNDTPQPIDLHRALAAWGEGASISTGGGGAPSEPGDATWIHTFYPDQFWSNPGGDFVATRSATQTVGTFGPHKWSSADMVTDVQLWLDSPAENFGWLLRGNEAVASSVRRFDSRENATAGNRPYVIVIYTPGVTATKQTTWGAIKTLYMPSTGEAPVDEHRITGRKP